MRICLYDFCRSTRNTTYQHDNDAGSDLDYAMARYYASRSGRFITPDPGHVGASIGDPQSWNAYTYSRNDPVNLVDPSGTKYLVCPANVNGAACQGGFELTDDGFDKFVAIGGYTIDGSYLSFGFDDDPLYYFFRTSIDSADDPFKEPVSLTPPEKTKPILIGISLFSNTARRKARQMSCAELLAKILSLTDAERIGRSGTKGLLQRFRDFLGDDLTHGPAILDQQRSLRTYLDEYIERCGTPPPVPVEVANRQLVPQKIPANNPMVGEAVRKIGTGALIYWIISEATRLFPPRNLVPVP